MIPKTAMLTTGLLLLLTSCGGSSSKKMVTVTGTVNYKGQMLTSGIVKFLAPNGNFAAATIHADGRFIMSEVVPGLQKVAYVSGPTSVGSSDGSSKKTATSNRVSVPAKFGDPQTSGATANVPDTGGEIAVELN